MITNNGKLQQLRLLAGEASRFADYFVFGASTGTPGAPDISTQSKSLKVGWGVCPVTDSYIDEDNHQVVFYATVPQSLAGLIGEIGLLSLDSSYIKQDKPATGGYFFNEGEDWTFEPEATFIDGETGQVRLGNRSVLLNSNEQQTAMLSQDMDLTIFNQMVILGDTSAPIDIFIHSGETDYAALTGVSLSSVGEVTAQLSSLTVTGEYDPSAVRLILIKLPPGNHVIDGIVFRDTNYGNLMAASEVTEPFYKSIGSNLEIEYAVKL